MLLNKQIAVVGGDARSIYMIEQLASKNATIYAIGFANIDFNSRYVTKCTIDNVLFISLDALILPVHGMDETFTVDQYFPTGEIKLSKKMFENLPQHSVIFTGTAKEPLKKLCQTVQRELIVLYELEQVAILNALPTAEATLQLAMQHTRRIIHGQNVMLTGFGRVAKATARLFQAVRASVHIVARSETDLAAGKTQGLQAISLKQMNNLIPSMNIFINTIPQLIFSADHINDMSQQALIIDVASNPGGTDFSAAQILGIKAIHALGLPGKTAPITAGEIITEPVINRLLS